MALVKHLLVNAFTPFSPLAQIFFRLVPMLYFVSFSVICWVDVFIRNIYKDILFDSFKHCQRKRIDYIELIA
jgi:hypothetical protein